MTYSVAWEDNICMDKRQVHEIQLESIPKEEGSFWVHFDGLHVLRVWSKKLLLALPTPNPVRII